MIDNEKKYLQAARLIETGTSKAKAARMVDVSYAGLCRWYRKETRKKRVEADVEELLAKTETKDETSPERVAFAKALLLTGMPMSEVAKMTNLKLGEVKVLAKALAKQVSTQVSKAKAYDYLPPLGTLKGENAQLQELATNLRLKVEIYALKKVLADVTPETDDTP